MSALTAATLIEHLRRARVNVRARTAHAAAARIEGLEMTRATLSKIRLELREGGETAMSCTVEGDPALDRAVVDIIGRVGTAIECEIRAQRPNDQQDLPLSTHGTGEQPEHSKGAPASNGKRRRRAAVSVQ